MFAQLLDSTSKKLRRKTTARKNNRVPRRSRQVVFEPLEDRRMLSGTWATGAPIPGGPLSSTPAVIDDQLYVVGVASGIPGPAQLKIYDPGTDTWDTTAAAPPLILGGAGVGAIDGKLYVAGGSLNHDSNSTTNAGQVYDPAMDSWTFIASMPTPRNSAASAVVDDKLYVIGGMQNCAPCVSLDAVEAYDPVMDSWTILAPLPTARSVMSAGAIDGKIYVVGGLNIDFAGDPATVLGTLEVYDPTTNTWDTSKAPMPTPRFGHFGVGVIDEKLHVLGGRSAAGTILDTHEVYDPATDTWVTETPMLTPRIGHAVAAIGSQLYAVGGVADPIEIWTQEPEVQTVQIDIKPGSDPNSINLTSNGMIAVAIFTTDMFDAAQVDASSVNFAGAFAAHSALEDVDGDGDLDMILHFRIADTNLRELYEVLVAGDMDGDGVLDSNRQEAQVTLTGETVDQVMIEGMDTVDLFLAGKRLRELLDDLAESGAI